jgi:hypothetical protein
MQKTERPLWECPKCGKKFITKNMWHSCIKLDLKSLFAKSEPQVFQLYRKFEALVRACGPVSINTSKNGIAFQVRVRALGCQPRKSYLRVGFAFSERRKNPRFVKVETFTPTFHAHWVHLVSEKDLDAELNSWIRDSYNRAAQKITQPNAS